MRHGHKLISMSCALVAILHVHTRVHQQCPCCVIRRLWSWCSVPCLLLGQSLAAIVPWLHITVHGQQPGDGSCHCSKPLYTNGRTHHVAPCLGSCEWWAREADSLLHSTLNTLLTSFFMVRRRMMMWWKAGTQLVKLSTAMHREVNVWPAVRLRMYFMANSRLVSRLLDSSPSFACLSFS